MNTAWHEFWISLYFLVVILWKCNFCVVCTLKKVFTIVWYGRNSLKMLLLLDINSVVLFTSNSLKMSVFFDSGMCVVLFGSNFMKLSVLFDLKSETCLLLLVAIVWKCEYFFIFFVTACFRFSCKYFLTIRMTMIKKAIWSIFDFFLSFSLQFFPAWFQAEKSWAAQWLSSSDSFRLVSLSENEIIQAPRVKGKS